MSDRAPSRQPREVEELTDRGEGVPDNLQLVYADPSPDGDERERYIVRLSGVRSRKGRARKNPEREMRRRSALCLEFAELRTPEAIVAFANDFGLLGPPVTQTILYRSRQHPGDSIYEWARSARAMSRAVEMMYALRTNDRTYLDRHLRWDGEELLYEDPQRALSRRRRPRESLSQRFRGDLLQRCGVPQGDIRAGAIFWLHRLVNDNLTRSTYAALLRVPASDEALPFAVGVEPLGLLGFMWLQLARVIEGGIEFRACARCKTRFALHPDVARSNRNHCSNACKEAKYEARVQAELDPRSRLAGSDPVGDSPPKSEDNVVRTTTVSANASRTPVERSASRLVRARPTDSELTQPTPSSAGRRSNP